MITMGDVMEFLVDDRAPGIPATSIAGIFDRLIWIVDDNGGEILTVRIGWLRGEDAFRVEVALLMNEVFPFDSRSEMEREFAGLAGRWPQFKDLCDSILRRWDKQYPKRQN